MNFIFSLFFVSIAAHAASENADEIIRRVDDIRNPSESYLMNVEIKDSENNSTYEVSIKGNDKTLIKTLDPPRDRGRNFLMLNEDMWAYIPNLKRAVRVSLGQKLNGQAANGDISRMRWSGDYDAIIESAESKDEWSLFLTAKKKGLTYDKIRAWVSKKDFRPIRAEFLTVGGKPLKKVTYSGYQNMAGKMRPTEILIQDANKDSQKSTVKVHSMEVKTFPGSIFNQNSLQ